SSAPATSSTPSSSAPRRWRAGSFAARSAANEGERGPQRVTATTPTRGRPWAPSSAATRRTSPTSAPTRTSSAMATTTASSTRPRSTTVAPRGRAAILPEACCGLRLAFSAAVPSRRDCLGRLLVQRPDARGDPLQHAVVGGQVDRAGGDEGVEVVVSRGEDGGEHGGHPLHQEFQPPARSLHPADLCGPDGAEYPPLQGAFGQLAGELLLGPGPDRLDGTRNGSARAHRHREGGADVEGKRVVVDARPLQLPAPRDLEGQPEPLVADLAKSRQRLARNEASQRQR